MPSAAQPVIGELEWFRFAVSRTGHFEGAHVVVSPTDYTGELGYEIFWQPKDAPAVVDAAWAAGQKFVLKPMGLEIDSSEAVSHGDYDHIAVC